MYFETIAGDNELVHDNKINSNKELKIIDPTLDIYQLFNQFNLQFFSEKLSSVFVEWNQQMTRSFTNRQSFYLNPLLFFYSCAGICIYESEGNFCRITLSEPLLKLRPREDLVQTLLVCLFILFSIYLFYFSSMK